MATICDIQDVDPLIDISQVMQLVPFSPSHIYRLMRQSKFPSSVKLGPSRVAWRKSEIVSYIGDPLAWNDREDF